MLAALIVSLPAILPLATRNISGFLQDRRDAEAGLFPACKRKIENYFDGPGDTLTSIKAVPGSWRKNSDIVNGKIDISYSLGGSSEPSPEDGAKAYITGVAIGLDPKEVGESVARQIDGGQSYDYRKRLEYSYARKEDQCIFGDKVIDLDENKEIESAMPSILNKAKQ